MAKPTSLPSKAKQDDLALEVEKWFVMPDADMVVRRHQVWTLLGWYHRKYVEPQLGFAGCFRRLWWQLTGQGHRLESPWEQIHRALEIRRIQRERQAAMQDTAGTMAIHRGAVPDVEERTA